MQIIFNRVDSDVFLKLIPIRESFKKALLGMRLTEEFIDSMTIEIEFREMVPLGVYGGRKGDTFKIYLCTRGPNDVPGFNRTVAHELKHLALDVLHPRPVEELMCVDGFYSAKRRRKWDEIDCQRAERKWGNLDFFEHPKTILWRTIPAQKDTGS